MTDSSRVVSQPSSVVALQQLLGGVVLQDPAAGFVTDSVDGIKVVNILAGLEEEVNTRRVKYLTPKEGKAKKNGAIYNKAGTEITVTVAREDTEPFDVTNDGFDIFGPRGGLHDDEHSVLLGKGR